MQGFNSKLRIEDSKSRAFTLVDPGSKSGVTVLDKGFTLIEMMVALSLVTLVTCAAGILLASGQGNWNRLYGRVYGGPATNGFLVQRVFDSVCRKASLRKCVIGENGDSLELYYWDEGSTAQTPENYARLYLEGSDVFMERGSLSTGTWQPDTAVQPENMLIAAEVGDLFFEMQDTAVRMYLTYEDETLMPVISSAVRHNK